MTQEKQAKTGKLGAIGANINFRGESATFYVSKVKRAKKGKFFTERGG